MNEIKIFESSEFGQVRTVTVDGEIMFVGKDVANILGYQNGSRDINRHVDDEDRQKAMIFDGNQDKETILINESGLYSLILSSKMPNAKKFKHWVTSVVLPSIRKNGGYIANQEDLSNEQILANAVLVAQNVIAEKDKLLKEKEECIIEMKPKVDYHDEVLNKSDLITMTIIAKDLGTTAAKLNQLMHDNRIIFKSGKSSTWCPYEEYKWLIIDGYADYQSYKVDHSSPILKWTERGRKWIIGNYELWLENI